MRKLATTYKSSGISVSILFFLLLIMAAGCTTDVEQRSGTSIVRNFEFPYDVTSINIDGDCLLLGSNSNHFARFCPATGEYTLYDLPPQLDNSATYQVYPLGPEKFLVSKRDHGALVFSDNKPGCPIPLFAKGDNYSAYWFEPLTDSRILMSTSNGLYVMDLQDDSVGKIDKILPDRDTTDVRQYIVYRTETDSNSIAAYANHVHRLDLDSLIIKESTPREDGYKVNDSIWLKSNGEILIQSGGQPTSDRPLAVEPQGKSKSTTVNIGFDYGNGRGAKAVLLGNDLYYISDSKLKSVDIQLIEILQSTTYSPLEFAAIGDKSTYLANSEGIFALRPHTAPEFIRPFSNNDKVLGAATIGSTIYYIDENHLYRLNPKKSFLPKETKSETIDKLNLYNRDQFTSIDAHDGLLWIGTRESLLRFNPSSGKVDSLKMLGTVGEKAKSNILVAAIDYPYVGTLGHGLFTIEGDRATYKAGSDTLKDIRRVCYNPANDSLVVCTNSSCYLISGDGTTKIDDIPIDVALVDGRFVGLFNGYRRTLPDGKMTVVPDFYTGIADVGGEEVLYSNKSIVDGYKLTAKEINWEAVSRSSIVTAAVLAVIAVILLVIVVKLTKKRNRLVAETDELKIHIYELKREKTSLLADIGRLEKQIDEYNADPVKFYRSRLLDKVIVDENYKNFVKDIPQERIGSLRRHFGQKLIELVDLKDSGSQQFEENLKYVLDLSREIIDSGRSMCKAVDARAKIFTDNSEAYFFGENNDSQRETALNFLKELKDVTDGISARVAKGREASMISDAMAIVSGFENIAEIITRHINAEQITQEIKEMLDFTSVFVLKSKSTAGNDEARKRICAFDRALSDKHAHLAVLLTDFLEGKFNFVMGKNNENGKVDINTRKGTMLYNWDYLMLGIFSDYDIRTLKGWLMWRYTFAFMKEGRMKSCESKKERTESVFGGTMKNTIHNSYITKISININDDYHIPHSPDDIFFIVFGDFLLKHETLKKCVETKPSQIKKGNGDCLG